MDLATIATSTRSRFRPGPAVAYVHPRAVGMAHADAEHDANLDVAEDSAPNYLAWIADQIRPYLGRHVLEVGAGTGAITELYTDSRDVLATDLSDWCVDQLHQRFDEQPNVTVRKADLSQLIDEQQRFDSVVLLNVLEHIEDDVQALNTLRQLLEPDGRIILYVPALNGLYGDWDRKVGHFRRYSPWRLRAVLGDAGLAPVEVRYMNMLSIPAWWAFSRGNVERKVGSKLSLWDKTGIPWGRKLESVIPVVPVGLNVFCVARIS